MLRFPLKEGLQTQCAGKELKTDLDTSFYIQPVDRQGGNPMAFQAGPFSSWAATP
jgi:hypothetical protein